MSNPGDPLSLMFRCPAGLEGILPPPIPASAGLPDWLRTMPAQTFNTTAGQETATVKRCPPFVDAMRLGFLIPLMCDVKVENGEFSWENELPPGGDVPFVRSPIGFHDPSQTIGTPLFRDDRFLIKFHNLWTIQAPAGYALFFTHPVNRFELPFTTLSGLVDSDRYYDNWIHFPAYWHDEGFSGVLRRGTPIAQVIPVLRDTWTARSAAFTEEEARRVHDLTTAISREEGIYRSRFRA